MFQTHRIEQEFIGYGAYRYKYDKNGNITSIESGTRNSDATTGTVYNNVISYYYDNLNELVREDNKYLNQTITYTYDGAGNITSKNIYAYTTGEITGEPKQSYSYSYNDTEWKDLLTSYNGEEITYDAIGNPTSYLGSTMTWKGHQLSSVEMGNTKATYTYDANGLRTTKTVNGTKTYYQYSGDKLIYQETGNKRLYFWYDAFGSLCEVLYDDNGTASAYMVVCNSRGDVERLYDVSGNLVTRYIYDSWGNVISVVDASNKQITNQNAIGNVNPIRYRGYYLDSETGYYYLQSRYYNPQLGRFLNADTICDTQTGILGTNMFSYCLNNPVMYLDSTGHSVIVAASAAFAIVMGIVLSLGLFAFSTGVIDYSELSIFLSDLFDGMIGTLVNSILLPITIIGILITDLADSLANISGTAIESIAGSAIIADVEIKSKVNSGSSDYWAASVNGGYVTISTSLTYAEALSHVRQGKNVFAANQYAAYDLAYNACGKNNFPIGPEIDSGKKNKIGFYHHYHPNPRNGAHIFYLL